MSLLLDFLEGLSVRAGAALPYVRELVATGSTATEIVSALKEAGMAFRRTDMLKMIRKVQDIDETKGYLKYVRKDLMPDATRLAAPVGQTLRRYSFTVKVSGTDYFTGESVVQHITISTDKLLTIGSMEQMAMNIANEAALMGGRKSSQPGMVPESATVLDGIAAY